MPCYYHNDRPATATCSRCGKSLCTECGGRFQPPTCVECVQAHAAETKSEMFKSIGISVVLMIIGVAVIQNPAGILLAGIPYGWSILTSITPTMFVWMPLVGWLIYFAVKFILAYFVGIVALPIKLYKWISELVKVKKLTDSINNHN